MAHCSRCGAKLPGAARFCPACGAAVGQDVPERTRSDEGRSGWWWLGLLGVVAAVVVAVALWNQRDGLRPVAEQASVNNDTDETPVAEEEPVQVSTPLPPPAPEPTPSPAAPVAIPAPAIDNEMAGDPDGTPARYRSPLAIRGIVRGVDLEGEAPVVLLGGRAPGAEVLAQFSPEDAAAVELLQPDMAVRLTCDAVRAQEEQTVLEGCRL